jgi:hypothetical protein
MRRCNSQKIVQTRTNLKVYQRMFIFVDNKTAMGTEGTSLTQVAYLSTQMNILLLYVPVNPVPTPIFA